MMQESYCHNRFKMNVVVVTLNQDLMTEDDNKLEMKVDGFGSKDLMFQE